MAQIALLAIGNELLNGVVRDQNLFVLARSLTRMGLTVAHAAIVRDDPLMIAGWVRFILAARPAALLLCGGLGPTADDLTLAALGEALQRPLREAADARALVERQYDHLLQAGYLAQRGPEAARVKMATLPEGAYPLHNPVGTAPGVRLEHDGVALFVLPGVPAEMEAIFAESVAPWLARHCVLGVWRECALRVHCDDEAAVAPFLRAVADRHPQVYLKSLAQPFPAAAAEGLLVLAAVCLADADQANALAAAALADLHASLVQAGFVVAAASPPA